MANSAFTYAIDIHRDTENPDLPEQGALLMTHAVEPDFIPAIEAARLDAIRRLPPGTRLRMGGDDPCIEPVWHSRLGAPYVESLRATISRESESPASSTIPAKFFGRLAKTAAASLIQNGQLAEGDRFRYLICAYPKAASPARNGSSSLKATALAQEIPLHEDDVAQLRRQSTPMGEISPQMLPTFIPRAVITEVTDLTEAAGAAETAGVLVGHLGVDRETRELFLTVTAQIPAKHAQQELTSVTFTEETWAAVDAALALRGQNELPLGWWHSHPARQWCKDCPIENRMVCARSGEFFSVDDLALHRAVFPRAYSIALVVSDSYRDGLTYPMFGWNHGLIENRGFHILES